jgi:hypothetical protein
VEPPVLENSGRTSREATALFPGSAVESIPELVAGSCGRGCVGQRTHSVPYRNTNVQTNISRRNETRLDSSSPFGQGMKFSSPQMRIKL